MKISTQANMHHFAIADACSAVGVSADTSTITFADSSHLSIAFTSLFERPHFGSQPFELIMHLEGGESTLQAVLAAQNASGGNVLVTQRAYGNDVGFGQLTPSELIAAWKTNTSFFRSSFASLGPERRMTIPTAVGLPLSIFTTTPAQRVHEFNLKQGARRLRVDSTTRVSLRFYVLIKPRIYC